MGALVVVDESLNPRNATELKRRGRQAVSVASLGFKGMKDEPLLRALAAELKDVRWVMLTADDAMPLDHGDVIEELGITVATVAPSPADVTGAAVEEWKWETVQRCIHKVASQPAGTVRRYSLTATSRWTAKSAMQRRALALQRPAEPTAGP